MAEITVEEFERRMDTVGVNREHVGLPFKRSLDELDADIKPKKVYTPKRDLEAIYKYLLKHYTNKAIPFIDLMAIADCEERERHAVKYRLQKHFKKNGYILRTETENDCYRFYKIPGGK